MSSKPQFVFFDLGNVLVFFSHDRAARQLAEVAGVDVETVQRVVFDGGLQTQYESGAIDDEQFAEIFSAETGVHVQADELQRANSDIFWLNREIVPVVTALQYANQPMAILSNTCPAHWKFVKEHFPIVPQCFPRHILSFESGCMKPDSGIYRDAIEMAQVEPQKIFFVDDRVDNVEGALRAGMDAHVFESVPQLVRLLHDRNLKLNV